MQELTIKKTKLKETLQELRLQAASWTSAILAKCCLLMSFSTRWTVFSWFQLAFFAAGCHYLLCIKPFKVYFSKVSSEGACPYSIFWFTILCFILCINHLYVLMLLINVVFQILNFPYLCA